MRGQKYWISALERTFSNLEGLAYDATWSREDLIVLLDHAFAMAAAERAEDEREEASG